MFFTPEHIELCGDAVTLQRSVKTSGVHGFAADVIAQLCAQYGKDAGTAGEITAKTSDDIAADGYRIDIGRERIEIAHSNERGLIYAVMTIKQLLRDKELKAGFIEDSPDCGFRGYRVYLPGRKSFKEFFDMVDMIVYYKYNYISFEIGGAMEYKRHPEINEKWAEFAADTHRYSDRTHEIQNGFSWAKNSIHTDNGEGDILTQDEVRELIAYCRYRGLTVYPEVPTLSHTDYICMAHPELAERAEDPYPDTYCPNHPDVYKIVFDVLEEVIEVFEPELINIGHDEYYSMCLCERCRGKKPQDVFAQDVTKIHDFLAQRGIKTCMWGDKLLPVVTEDGKTYGGAGSDRMRKNQHILFPPTFQCQCMLPRDIMMFQWYYRFGMQHDLVFHTHGYPMVYGNMAADKVEHWRLRRNLGARGGSCSNWGSNHPEYMQRNNQYLNLIFGAYAMWSRGYDDSMLGEVMTRAFDEAYALHYPGIRDGGYIEVVHTTKQNIPYKVFYDGVFIEDEKYHMGRYVVTYTDKSTAEFEVKYGTNIAFDGIPCALGDDSQEIDPTLSVAESALGEVSYSTVPRSADGRTWYRTAFKNPHPEKTISEFRYISDNGEDVEIKSVKF